MIKQRSFPVGIVSLGAAVLLMSSAQAGDLGWVVDDSAGACRGYYEEPERARDATAEAFNSSAETESSPINLQADQVHWGKDGSMTLEGNVNVRQGSRLLQATQIEVDGSQQNLRLNGNAQLREPGMLIEGENARINRQSGAATITSADYLIYQNGGRGHADRIKREEDLSIRLEKGSYTSCPPTDNSWVVRSSRIDLDPSEGFGKAYNAQILIKDVPILYIPYIEFPINDQRKTGFLWPNISSSGEGGIDLATPYYINLAPDYDLTLTPRYMGGHGYITEAEGRYLNKVSEWVIAGSYLDSDRINGTEEARWVASIDEAGEFADGWFTKVDATKVSDNEYFEDLGTVGLDVSRSTLLNQQALFGYQDANWLFTTEVQSFQVLADNVQDPYTLLPRLSVSYQPDISRTGVQPTLFGQYTFYEHRELTRGQRIYAEPGLSLPLRGQQGFLVVDGKLKQLNYQMNEGDVGASEQSTSAWQGSLDGGLFFDRTDGRGRTVQSLEPRLYYLYTQAQTQDDQPLLDTNSLPFSYEQLFRDTRFSGYDRISDANQLTAALTSRWREGAREQANLSLGQIFYFSDREVALPDNQQSLTSHHSDVVSRLQVMPSDRYLLSNDLIWNPDLDQMQEASLISRWRNARWNLFNLGYRLRRDHVTDTMRQQLETSGLIAVHEQINLVGRWRYDLDDRKSLEELAGVEYDSCCWNLRLVYQHERESLLDGAIQTDTDSVEYEHAIFLQVELKGLGNLAGRVNQLLEESILGYYQRETNYH